MRPDGQWHESNTKETAMGAIKPRYASKSSPNEAKPFRGANPPAVEGQGRTGFNGCLSLPPRVIAKLGLARRWRQRSRLHPGNGLRRAGFAAQRIKAIPNKTLRQGGAKCVAPRVSAWAQRISGSPRARGATEPARRAGSVGDRRTRTRGQVQVLQSLTLAAGLVRCTLTISTCL